MKVTPIYTQHFMENNNFVSINGLTSSDVASDQLVQVLVFVPKQEYGRIRILEAHQVIEC